MKLWQKILLRVPKVGLAYRAYRWFRFTRRYRLIGLAKLLRQLKRGAKRAKKEGVHDMKTALQSKTIWGMIVMAISFVLGQFTGIDIDQSAATDLAMEIVSWVGQVIGGGLTFYGRLKATMTIKGVV